MSGQAEPAWCMAPGGAARRPPQAVRSRQNSVCKTGRPHSGSRVHQLFAIDAEARHAGMDQASRHAVRQERSQPLLEVMGKELEATRHAALPSSALGKAVHYALSLWPKLTCFLDHAEVGLSKNLAENSMRPVVLGRENWIHLGTEQAGPKVAAILSVFESCRRLRIPFREYLFRPPPWRVLPSRASATARLPAGWPPVADPAFTANLLITKPMPNVLGKISTLRIGCQEIFVTL